MYMYMYMYMYVCMYCIWLQGIPLTQWLMLRVVHSP